MFGGQIVALAGEREEHLDAAQHGIAGGFGVDAAIAKGDVGMEDAIADRTGNPGADGDFAKTAGTGFGGEERSLVNWSLVIGGKT